MVSLVSEPRAVATGSSDCGLATSDCGLEDSATLNPQSEIRDPLPTSFVREFNLFTAYGFSSNVIQIDFKSESWFVWHLDGAIVGHFHLWHDHVSRKVTRAGRDVSGKRESRQARER